VKIATLLGNNLALLATLYYIPLMIVLCAYWVLLVRWTLAWNKTAPVVIPFPKHPWIVLAVLDGVYILCMLTVIILNFWVPNSYYSIVGAVFAGLSVIGTLYMGCFMIYFMWKSMRGNDLIDGRTKLKIAKVVILVNASSVLMLIYSILAVLNPTLRNIPESTALFRDRVIGFTSLEFCWIIVILVTFLDWRCNYRLSTPSEQSTLEMSRKSQSSTDSTDEPYKPATLELICQRA